MKPLTTMTVSPAQFANMLRRRPDAAVGEEPLTSTSGTSSCRSSREESGDSSGPELRRVTGYSVPIPCIQVSRDRREGSQVSARHFPLPGLVEADWQYTLEAHAIPEHVHLAVRGLR